MDLYVASWENGGGKTTVSAGLARRLTKSGVKVGYLSLGGSGAAEDAGFMKQALGLEEPVEAIAPKAAESASDPGGRCPSAKAKEARNAVTGDKDLVIVEGVGGLGMDDHAAEAAREIVQVLGARVIVVISYSENMQVDQVAASLKKFGQNLLGVVVNRVPRNRMANARMRIAEALERHGVKILGLLREERVLFGVTVGELAGQLQAETVCCKDRLGELVNNVMIGVLTADSGKDYFERKDHKAVITRGERPDMQLAALSTPTVGLILTGGTGPIPQVKAWAEEKYVPIVVTRHDTLATVSEVENAIVSARFRHRAKLEALEEIISKDWDFTALMSSLRPGG